MLCADENFFPWIDICAIQINKYYYYTINKYWKQKRTRKRPTQGQGATFIITEMSFFTLETDYSCETGYPCDDSRQIGNTSLFENGIALILNEQSAWLYPSISTDSLKTGSSVADSLCTATLSPQKKSEKGCVWGECDCTQASLCLLYTSDAADE